MNVPANPTGYDQKRLSDPHHFPPGHSPISPMSMNEVLQRAHSLSKEAEDAALTGQWQQAVEKFQNSASCYLQAATHAETEQSSTTYQRLATEQEERAKELIKQVTAARSFAPLGQSSPSILGVHHRTKSIEEKKEEELPLNWDEFWRSVDDLLTIIPDTLTDGDQNWLKVTVPDGDKTSDHPDRSASPLLEDDDFFWVPQERAPATVPVTESEIDELSPSPQPLHLEHGAAYGTLLAELNEKSQENEILKKCISQCRQQLKFKVSRLRQFSEFTNDSDSNNRLRELRNQIEDRDKQISLQQQKIKQLEERWENVKKTAQLRKLQDSQPSGISL